jgi:hypothetical protein
MMGEKSSAPIAEYRHRFGGGPDAERVWGAAALRCAAAPVFAEELAYGP